VLSIKIGPQTKNVGTVAPLSKDEIRIRGPGSEVDRAVQKINEIIEDAKNSEINNGFVCGLIVLERCLSDPELGRMPPLL
jgi:hypothetical protein